MRTLLLTSFTSTHQLGTIQDLGILIENSTKAMRIGLESWSTTLFNGGQDNSGKTIMYVLIHLSANQEGNNSIGTIWLVDDSLQSTQ